MIEFIRGAWLSALLVSACVLSGCGESAAKSATLHRQAPEFAGIDAWLNSEPVRLADLRGQVVLVEFWTHECINCLRSMPHVVQWHQKYKDQGLVVIGVHTPEYPEERQTDQVQAAMKRLGITFPVAQDNEYITWYAYQNQFWPATYLIDINGRIARRHYGEGHYEETEEVIRELLAARQAASSKS
jgi:thiol-disulfide isomerase/thioredoxin